MRTFNNAGRWEPTPRMFLHMCCLLRTVWKIKSMNWHYTRSLLVPPNADESDCLHITGRTQVSHCDQSKHKRWRLTQVQWTEPLRLKQPRTFETHASNHSTMQQGENQRRARCSTCFCWWEQCEKAREWIGTIQDWYNVPQNTNKSDWLPTTGRTQVSHSMM